PRRAAPSLSYRSLPPGKRGRGRRDRSGRVSGRGRGGGGGVGRKGASFSPGGAADDFARRPGRGSTGAPPHRERTAPYSMARPGQKKVSLPNGMEGDSPEWIRRTAKRSKKSRRRWRRGSVFM